MEVTTPYYEDLESYPDNQTAWPALSERDPTLKATSHAIKTYVIPVIGLLGVIGNTINVLILIKPGNRFMMPKMDLSARVGFLALSFCDLCVCALQFPRVFSSENSYVFSSRSFNFYYQVYSLPLVNTFILLSTWVTVLLAVTRYIVVSCPLHAKIYVNFRRTVGALSVLVVMCILFNLPYLWHISVQDTEFNGKPILLLEQGEFSRFKTTAAVYEWLSLGFRFLIPVIVLCVCNVGLIRALRRATRERNALAHPYRIGGSNQNSQAPIRTQQDTRCHRITITMIAIIVVFILFVSPAEVIDIIANYVHSHSGTELDVDIYLLLRSCVNTLQIANFAVNVLLYCAINAQFRRAIKQLFCCFSCCRSARYRRGMNGNHSMSTTAFQGQTTVTDTLLPAGLKFELTQKPAIKVDYDD